MILTVEQERRIYDAVRAGLEDLPKPEFCHWCTTERVDPRLGWYCSIICAIDAEEGDRPC